MNNFDFSVFGSYVPSGRRDDRYEVLGISGGRSSAATLLMLINGGFGFKPNHIISFQNTGREEESCYKFLNDLQLHTGVNISMIEYSLTDKFINEFVFSSFSYEKFEKCEYSSIGQILNVEKLRSLKYDRNLNSFWYKEGFHDWGQIIRQVNYNTASRNGKPFADNFLYKCAIRIMKGEGLILPTGAQRWCTGDMKEKLLHNWLKLQGIKSYTKYLGIRHDEPKRAAAIFLKNTANIWHDLPLFWSNINKGDIMRNWALQPFDLGLIDTGENCFRDVIGNCIYCHLKKKIKKLYLMQNGFSPLFYMQIETLVNNYNGDVDAMNRGHGTYEKMQAEAAAMQPITEREILSDEEIEFSCTNCGD